MPAASQVVPAKWSQIKVLFDNGEYSIISGCYNGASVLGERWNGAAGELGFPNQAGHPIWHVVPPFLRKAILHKILGMLAWNPPANAQQQVNDIFGELVRLSGEKQ